MHILQTFYYEKKAGIDQLHCNKDITPAKATDQGERVNYILGLDLGPTSIGWAVVECAPEGAPLRLVDANSRIFLAMIEADTRVPKNKNRREKRSMRRQVRRYKERREQLVKLLAQHGLLAPTDSDPQSWERALNALGSPFVLRAEALSRPLSSAELGRVFLHLLRRRGYKSNRGAKYQALLDDLRGRSVSVAFQNEESANDEEEADEAAKETGLVLSGIKLLRAAMSEKQCDTVAQLVVKLAREAGYLEPRRPHTLTQEELTKKGRAVQYHLYASRELYQEEFAAIWSAQAKYHPDLLTDELKLEVHRIIFYQRPLQSQRGRVGKCSLRIDKPRAAKALLDAQEYRLLEDLNNLEYELPKQQGAFRLTAEEREKILTAIDDPGRVSERGQLRWAEIKKLVQKSKAKFNLERTSKNGLMGNRTALALARLIPATWASLGRDKATGETYSSLQKALVQDLVNIENKLALFNRLINRYGLPPERCPWQFSEQEAFGLATLELEEGYVKHCRSVIGSLLPHLRRGIIYTDALAAAGYLRRDQMERRGLPELSSPPDIANPIVQKALFETRRVVNAIIKRCGEKPKIVRIEMAREMKASKSHRADIEKQQRTNQKANDDAAEEIRKLARTYPDLGIKVSREAILKYKLMLEQARSCAYSDPERTIVERMLFDGSVEIDHIYPLSVSLDDSYMNKVLCFTAENRDKGKQTPWQAWHGTDKYENILKRLERLPDYPRGKLRRLKDDKFDASADFVAAQLNDTRYICVAVRNYVATLGYDDQHLQVSRGQMTAELRRLWGLSNLLPKADDVTSAGEVNPETGEIAKEPPSRSQKKDRGDHRHHAVDAIVTALVDRPVFADLMRRYRYREDKGTWPEVPLRPPITDLRAQAERIVLGNIVSHAANRKVSGGLHDELPFGLGGWIENAVPLKKLLRSPEVIRCEPDGTPGKSLDGEDHWIAQESARRVLRQWLKNYELAGKRKDFPPPILPDGSEVTNVDVANRCYVKRAPVETALSKLENNPGQKTWIVDQGVRAALREWRKAHKDKEATANPPRMPRADGDEYRAHPIRTVRIATKASGVVQFNNRPQIFAKSSNHHIVIFKRTGPDGAFERKGVFVDMLEAAKRVRRPPIVRKDPIQLLPSNSTINPVEWRFEMALCNQDMVLWDENAVPDDQRHLGKPVYRLQKMSGANNTLIFRHFSVTSTSDSDRRGLIQKTPETLPPGIRKVRVNALGEWDVIGGD